MLPAKGQLEPLKEGIFAPAAMVANAFKPSIQEAEAKAGESLWVQGQPGLHSEFYILGESGLHSETLSQKN